MVYCVFTLQTKRVKKQSILGFVDVLEETEEVCNKKSPLVAFLSSPVSQTQESKHLERVSAELSQRRQGEVVGWWRMELGGTSLGLCLSASLSNPGVWQMFCAQLRGLSICGGSCWRSFPSHMYILHWPTKLRLLTLLWSCTFYL